jgi:hypothetical protein
MRHGIKRAIRRALDEGVNSMLAFYARYDMDPVLEAVVCRVVTIARNRATVEWLPSDQWHAANYARGLIEPLIVIPETLCTDRNGVRPEQSAIISHCE